MTPSNPVSEALRKFSIWCESDSLPPYLAAAAEDAGFWRLWLGGPPASLANVEQILAVQLLTPDPNDDVRPYLVELAAALQRYEAAH